MWAHVISPGRGSQSSSVEGYIGEASGISGGHNADCRSCVFKGFAAFAAAASEALVAAAGPAALATAVGLEVLAAAAGSAAAEAPKASLLAPASAAAAAAGHRCGLR